MKRSAVTLLWAVMAVVIAGCQRAEPVQPSRELQVGQGFQFDRQPEVAEEHRAAADPLPHDDPPADEDPPAEKDPPADEEPLLLEDDPPLLLDDDPPLLLDEGEQQFQPPSGPVADNSRCFVCHMSYMQEKLAVVHARQNISCADCHGNCDEHIADESWAWGKNGTPPGIMYLPEKINPFCMGCHPKDKIDKSQHKSLFAGTAKEKYCTDCHGDHRLDKRKCKWK